jgi:hypothetical protein
MFLLRKLVPKIFEGVDAEILNKIVDIDGNIVGLKYETPLMTARGEIKRDKLLGYMQAAAMLIGPEAAQASLNAVKIPEYLRESYGLEADLIKTPKELQFMLDTAAEELANQSQDVENGVPLQ